MAHAVSSTSSTQSSNIVGPPFIQGMPNDVTVLFFEWLRLPDVEVSSLVCRSWNELLGLESVWQRLLEWHYSEHTITLQEGETHQSAYRGLHRYLHNLKNFVFSCSTLPLRESCIMATADEKLILGYENSKSIKIFDSRSLKKLRNFRMRLPGLGWAVKDQIVAGAGKLILQTLGDNNIERVFLIPDARSFLVQGGKFQLREIAVDPSSSIAIEGDNIYTGTLDGKIQIRSLQSDQKDVILDSRDRVYSMLAADKKLYASTHTTIDIWDLSQNTYIKSLETVSISMTLCEKNYLFTNDLREFKIWDVQSGQCIATQKFLESWNLILKIAFSGKRLFIHKHNEILSLDFMADRKTVLKEIADLFAKSSHTTNSFDSARDAIERLFKLPKSTQKEIQEEFMKILQNSFPAAAFSPGLFLTHPIKAAEAIRNVLTAPKSLEHPQEKEKRERESMNNQNNPPNKGE